MVVEEVEEEEEEEEVRRMNVGRELVLNNPPALQQLALRRSATRHNDGLRELFLPGDTLHRLL